MRRNRLVVAAGWLAVLALLAGCPVTPPNDATSTLIESFVVTPLQVARGEEVTLSWRASRVGSHPSAHACSLVRRAAGEPAGEPFEVACQGTLTEVPPADASASYVRYQLNVLKDPYDASDPYVTAAVTVTLEEEASVPRVLSVSIDQDDLALGVGDATPLSATVVTEGGASAAIAWTSGNEDIATVGDDGTVTGVRVGTTLVSATSTIDPARSDSILVDVHSPTGPVLWTRQFGTTSHERARSVAVDDAGDIVVAGYTDGNLAGANAGLDDVFVRRYAPGGVVVWTRQFGTASADSARGVAVDAAGNVLVVGYTGGDLAGTSAGGDDAFVRKYDVTGDVVWTRQFGSDADDGARAVAVDDAGSVLVVGYTFGDLEGSGAGEADVFVRKYDAAGTALWTRQFGTLSFERANAVAVDAAGNVVLAGYTYGDLGGVGAGSSDVLVRKYDADGAELWTTQLGSASYENAYGVAIDDAGSVLVAGYTSGVLGGASAGLDDAFVSKLDASGAEVWTRQFGTAAADVAHSVAADAAGGALVAGSTGSTLADEGFGMEDVFVRRYDAGGSVAWTRQFGTASTDEARGVALDPSGNVVVAGYTSGALQGVGFGLEDAFVQMSSSD